jgi:uncharacterized cupredoxin-like copper-binding protein
MKRKGVAVLAAIAAGGCATSQHSTGNTSYTRTASGAAVQVVLDEYRIHMPTTIPSGDIDFAVKNAGSHTHNIEIQGHGVDAKLPKDLAAGESADLRVSLPPGTYKVFCPVGPHASMGMRLELTVTQR